MEKRVPGSNPMLENKIESNQTIDRNERYKQIIEVLNGKKMTFREIAKEMYMKGYTPGPETTYSQPRVTELVHKGKIEPIGKVKSDVTGKTVTVFALREV